MKKISTADMVLCAMCAAITCVLAPISVPIGPIPISLCTFAVMLAGVLLGAKLGFVSQLIYVLLGAVGLPVFAGYTAGLAKIAGVTGGYIVGYPFLALVIGLIYGKFGRGCADVKRKVLWMFIGMIAGTAVLYAIGTVWYCVLSGNGVIAALGACVIPFLPGDFLKMVVVAIVSVPVEKALNKIRTDRG